LALGLGLQGSIGVFSDLGLPLQLLDDVGAGRIDSWDAFVGCARRRLALSVGVTVAMVIAYHVASPEAPLLVPVLLGISLAATAVHHSATCALRAKGTVVPDAFNEVLSRLGLLGVGALVLALGGGPVAAAGLYALADVCSALAIPIALRRRSVPSGKAWRAPSRRRFLALSSAMVLSSLHARLDVWLIGLWRPEVDVARYAVAYRFLDTLVLPAVVAAGLLVPSTAALEGTLRAKSALRAVSQIAALATVAALAVALLARPLLATAFGSSYEIAGPTLQVLMIAVPGAVMLLGLVPVVAVLRPQVVPAVLGVCLVENAGVNVMLIGSRGTVGAAIATVVSCSTGAVLLILALVKASSYVEPPTLVRANR